MTFKVGDIVYAKHNVIDPIYKGRSVFKDSEYRVRIVNGTTLRLDGKTCWFSVDHFHTKEKAMKKLKFQTGWYHRTNTGVYSGVIVEVVYAGEKTCIAYVRKSGIGADREGEGSEVTLSQDYWNENQWEKINPPRIEYFAAFKDDKGGTSYQGPFTDPQLARDYLTISNGARSTTYGLPYGILKLTHWDDKVDTVFIIWNNEI
jgi:hypothetical protein